MMPPMKYWELIADKLNANGLGVGLSQRGYAAWLALEADARTTATVAGTSAGLTS
jgi:hypothetical protein